MAPGKHKSDLTPRQRQLVETMQRVRFGRIEHLVIRAGDPVIERGVTRVIRTIRFDGAADPHPALGHGDTVLKARVVQMLQRLEKLGDLTVGVLHFGDGLPGSMEIDDDWGDPAGRVSGASPTPVRPATAAGARNSGGKAVLR